MYIRASVARCSRRHSLSILRLARPSASSIISGPHGFRPNYRQGMSFSSVGPFSANVPLLQSITNDTDGDSTSTSATSEGNVARPTLTEFLLDDSVDLSECDLGSYVSLSGSEYGSDEVSSVSDGGFGVDDGGANTGAADTFSSPGVAPSTYLPSQFQALHSFRSHVNSPDFHLKNKFSLKRALDLDRKSTRLNSSH